MSKGDDIWTLKTLGTPSQLQLGFIGGGLSSSIGRSHFSACQMDSRWKVVSGCFSHSKEIGIATAKAWHLSENRVYESWQQFIQSEKEKLDAVVVLAPSPNHSEIIINLLKNNIPIISEKPMVATLKAAKLIHKSLDSSPGFLAVTYNYSGYPMVRELKERIKNGEFGDLINLQFEMPQEVFLRIDPATGQLVKSQNWRLKDGEIPTICLDLGVHLHHLAYFISGKRVLKTAAEFSNNSAHEGLIDDVMMWLKYEGGMKASFWMSKSALGHRNGLRLRVYGTKASAEWLQSEPEDMRISYNDGSRVILDRATTSILCGDARYNRYRAGHPSGFIEAFANLYGDIADDLIGYRQSGKQENPFVFGIDHSLHGLELFSAAVQANNLNQWVDLPNTDS